ncbi:hypothetical protein L7F22_034020 [Adiantum nelumboides]|nr:hypothetical protein [Adiantum nelumboides]
MPCPFFTSGNSSNLWLKEQGGLQDRAGPSALERLCRCHGAHAAEIDEVYARIRLQPNPNGDIDVHDNSPASPPLPKKSAPFAKTLTQSDANNGGGFSIHRC